jgi:hypothetical protein
MNWDDPAARARLIERVGIDEYNRLIEEHMEKSIVARVDGYSIRPIVSARFGRIFMIDGANIGFATLERCKEWIRKQRKEPA